MADSEINEDDTIRVANALLSDSWRSQLRRILPPAAANNSHTRALLLKAIGGHYDGGTEAANVVRWAHLAYAFLVLKMQAQGLSLSTTNWARLAVKAAEGNTVLKTGVLQLLHKFLDLTCRSGVSTAPTASGPATADYLYPLFHCLHFLLLFLAYLEEGPVTDETFVLHTSSFTSPLQLQLRFQDGLACAVQLCKTSDENFTSLELLVPLLFILFNKTVAAGTNLIEEFNVPTGNPKKAQCISDSELRTLHPSVPEDSAKRNFRPVAQLDRFFFLWAIAGSVHSHNRVVVLAELARIEIAQSLKRPSTLSARHILESELAAHVGGDSLSISKSTAESCLRLMNNVTDARALQKLIQQALYPELYPSKASWDGGVTNEARRRISGCYMPFLERSSRLQSAVRNLFRLQTVTLADDRLEQRVDQERRQTLSLEMLDTLMFGKTRGELNWLTSLSA